MIVGRIAQIAFLTTLFACASQAVVQTASAPAPASGRDQRTIRRTIPMTNTILHAFALGTRDSTGRPTAKYWQPWMEYTINARLDVPTSTITGRERVVLHNTSDSSWFAIPVRLDQNYFAPNAARLDAIEKGMEVTSGMTVTRLTINGQDVTILDRRLPRGATPARPPFATDVDKSVGVIALANAIPAKGSATLEAEWSFKVPGIEGLRGQRMGRFGDTLYQVAQWYPRVMVYDDLRGWDTEPYLGNAEFYNNFGKWDVSLDVPAGWLVGATGTLRNAESVLSPTTRERLSHATDSDEQRSIVGVNDRGAGKATAAGDRLVWRFTADTANDFAWATSKAYVWDATRATIPGRGVVPINMLYQPGDTTQYRTAGTIARHALEFYSKLWMPYAFPQLTLASGPEMGMEYPMFLMSGVGAGDHETGHEWWPMMVSNNETWYGWMDEGFNEYMNILSANDRGIMTTVLNGRGMAYGGTSGNEIESPMMWPANYQAEAYGFTTYSKAPMMLSMLGGIVGDSAVQRAMSGFARAWRFKHPSPWDYMFMMQNALNQDLGWFWYYWLFTTESVDGSIQRVTTGADGSTNVVVRQDGEMPSPIVLRVELRSGASGAMPANARMLDANTALVTYPVDVWFSGNRTYTATLNFGRPITRIQLDPNGRFPDKDLRDNVWPR